MNSSQGHSGTKFNVNRACFPQEKTPEFTKMGEIHELFVLALSLVWFAGATPDYQSLASTPLHDNNSPKTLSWSINEEEEEDPF